MAGVKALRKIQIGRESTAGTAVPATEIWRGEGAGEDQRTVVFPVEDVGYLYRTEFLRPFGVAALHQSIVERLAAVDPSSEMGTCHFGSGIREILKS